METRTISAAWGTHVAVGRGRVKAKAGKGKRVIRARFSGQHKGLDLTAPSGTDIYATLDGQVVEARRQNELGNYVIIDHGNGLTTLYAHAETLFAEAGAHVERDQRIALVALVGRTGMATSPHLRFEAKVAGERVNPLPMLNDREDPTWGPMATRGVVSR